MKQSKPIEETNHYLQWDNLKETAFPLISALLHQPVDIGGKMEKSLNQSKFLGIKLWITPWALLAEYKNRRVLVPTANVAKADH